MTKRPDLAGLTSTHPPRVMCKTCLDSELCDYADEVLKKMTKDKTGTLQHAAEGLSDWRNKEPSADRIIAHWKNHRGTLYEQFKESRKT